MSTIANWTSYSFIKEGRCYSASVNSCHVELQNQSCNSVQLFLRDSRAMVKEAKFSVI